MDDNTQAFRRAQNHQQVVRLQESYCEDTNS